MSVGADGREIGSDRARSLRWIVLANLGLALAYLAFGRFALYQAVPPGYATLIFFPSGIALAAVVTFGARLLPGVALGALVLNLGSGKGELVFMTVVAAILLAVGSTLQTWVGSTLFQRRCQPALSAGRSIVYFLMLAPTMCLVSATFGVLGLFLLHLVPREAMASNWVFWWAGDTIGVLLAAPLTWLVFGQPRRLWQRRRWLIALPLCFSSVAFIFIYIKVSTLEEQQQQHQFYLNAQKLSDIFQYQFSEHERLLYAMGSLFYQSQITTPENFSRMARGYLDNRPELRLISWAPRVAGTQRQQFEHWAQQGVASSFAIRQFDSEGKTKPAADSNQYFVTSFIEPMAGNEKVLGIDMLSEPVRAAMVRTAIARRRPTASEAIKLVQEHRPSTGILLAQMVFPPDAGPNANPLGMLVAVIQVEPYIRLAMMQQSYADIAVRLDDVTSKTHPQLMLESDMRGDQFTQYKKVLELGGRSYQITLSPSEAYIQSHQGWQSWGALGTGMVLTGLLGAFLLLISGQREQIEALVVERTNELHEREARLKAILDEAADAILTVDEDGSVMSANGAAERLFGYQHRRMKGLHIGVLLPGENGALLAQLARHLQAPSRHDGGVDLMGQNSAGLRFPVVLAASLVELPEEVFYVCIVHDLTEQRQAEQKILALEALKQTQNELMTAEKMASLGSLVAGIAHELNTPIGNSLLAATSLSAQVATFEQSLADGAVRRSELQEHFKQAAYACELISGSLHRVADLISTFKQVAVDQTIDQRRDFDLLTVVEATLHTHATALQRANCTLTVAIPIGISMKSYPGSVSQVLTGLVNNALLHAFSGRNGGTIRISARELEQDMIEILFRDDGIGMPPEILRRVFDPFFTTKLGQGSSGLGMNIVYNVVTGMLGGRVAIESVPGMGTSVILTVPRSCGERGTVAVPEPQPQQVKV